MGGGHIKLRYAHQGGSNPPTIIVHGNRTARLPASYKRYLENTFRRVFELRGTPIRMEFRSGENPYSGRPRNSPKKKTASRRPPKRR